MRRSPFVSSICLCLSLVLPFLGAIRGSAVVLFLVPAVLIQIAVSAAGRSMTVWGRVGGGLASALVWAVVVNAASGDNMGPVARSTALISFGVVVLLAGATSRRPSIVMAGVATAVGAAVFYGAGGEIWPIVPLLLVLAGLVVREIGQPLGHDSRSGRRSLWLALFVVIAAIVAGGVLASLSLDSISDRVESELTDPIAVRPPWQRNSLPELPDASAVTTTVAATSVPAVTTTVAATSSMRTDDDERPMLLIAVVLVLLVVVFVAFGFRPLLEARKRRAFARRLRRRSNYEALWGAWIHLRYSLRCHGRVIPHSTPVEAMADFVGETDWPEELRVAVLEVAQLLTDHGYRMESCDGHVVDAVWSGAERAIEASRTSTERLERIKRAFVGVKQ